MTKRSKIEALATCNRGTAVIECALVMPFVLTLLMGILSYGQWFYYAHAMQQMANDAARAALPGLSVTERASLAQAAVNQDLATVAGLAKAATSLAVQDNGSQVIVTMTYDASASPLMRTSLVPLPSTTINRSAALQLRNF